jgi:Uma2 family endonuclease
MQATGLMTADELLMLPRRQQWYELVDGHLLTMTPTGSEHGVVIMNISDVLLQNVRKTRGDRLFGAETGFKIRSNPNTVRAPDIAYIRKARIEMIGIPKGFWQGAPDLAVEVVSPGDSRAEVEYPIHETHRSRRNGIEALR